MARAMARDGTRARARAGGRAWDRGRRRASDGCGRGARGRGRAARETNDGGAVRLGADPPTPTTRAPPLVIARSVRGGEVIEHAGDVVVKGDVERDGAVRARGDVFVWGSLRGEVEIDLGEDGDDAEVRALDMRPEVLRIGKAVMDAPAHLLVADAVDGRPLRARPEIARERDGKIVIGGMKPLTTSETANDPARAVRKSAKVTGAYIGLVGVALLARPRAVFSLLFNALEISSVWIRVFGVLCVTFGIWYTVVPSLESKGISLSYYRASVFGRAWVFASLVAIAVLEPSARLGLILLGSINALSAFVMHRAIACVDR